MTYPSGGCTPAENHVRTKIVFFPNGSYTASHYGARAAKPERVVLSRKEFA
jgi:hypothetical protein